jgi:hypothetical protein
MMLNHATSRRVQGNRFGGSIQIRGLTVNREKVAKREKELLTKREILAIISSETVRGLWLGDEEFHVGHRALAKEKSDENVGDDREIGGGAVGGAG